MPSGFPLPLRNALAELALAAHDDDAAAAALEWLVTPAGPPRPAAAARLAALHLIDPGEACLLAVHAPHAARVAEHERRALRAAAGVRAHAPAGGLARTIVRAVALWNEGLFFEVHEALEPTWQAAAGPTRQALQGVIQIAVAFHHLHHGNPRGVRGLLREGRARLASVPPGTLAPLDLAALEEATASWEERVAAEVPSAAPPRLLLRR